MAVAPSLPAPVPETAAPSPAQNRRMLILIGMSLLVASFANDLNLADLPLKFLLKDIFTWVRRPWRDFPR